MDSNYFVLSIMYKSVHGLGSTTHCCASYSLPAPNQLWLQNFSSVLLRGCLEVTGRGLFFFPRLNSYRWNSSQKIKKLIKYIPHIPLISEVMHRILSSRRCTFSSLPLSPESSQTHRCSAVLCFHCCNGLTGTCGFCLCFCTPLKFFSLPLRHKKHYANEPADICFQLGFFSGCLGMCVCVPQIVLALLPTTGQTFKPAAHTQEYQTEPAARAYSPHYC